MKIHYSEYEKDGWIPLRKEKPEKLKTVRLACIRLIDWNIEVMEWESTGKLHSSGFFGIRWVHGIDLTKAKPTHWREL